MTWQSADGLAAFFAPAAAPSASTAVLQSTRIRRRAKNVKPSAEGPPPALSPAVSPTESVAKGGERAEHPPLALP